MSEVVLQTIVEKLGSIELLLKVTDTGKGNVPDMGPIKLELESLRNEIKALPLLLIKSAGIQETQQNSVTNTIEHKHHLHKGIWIAICLFITCILLAYGWMSSHQTLQILKANDIKYRYLKIRGNKNVLDLCKYTDSLYQKDGNKFSAIVEQDEQHLIEQANRIRLAGEIKKTPGGSLNKISKPKKAKSVQGKILNQNKVID